MEYPNTTIRSMPVQFSRYAIVTTIATLLFAAIGCGGGATVEGKFQFLPEDIKGSSKFTTGSIDVELECCDKESTMLGELWVGTVIVENNTDISLRNFGASFTLEGKGGFVLPELEADGEVNLDAGQKAKMKLWLNGDNGPIDAKDIAKVPSISISYD